ncbi:MAG: PepSY-associated TM helix domain-containing protein [Onishia taeanensis]|uniref:PepSY-associated TM helix domain-containing protein n=1 Tax=Onishia taeanensis TaxID=284577 RepID=UPI003C7A1310
MTEHATASPHTASTLKALIIRLHGYIGLMVGPFILFAALTGTLYALTPALEKAIYHEALTTDPTESTADVAPAPLAEQIAAAQAYLGDDRAPSAIRPAPEPGTTTRVMFNDPSLEGGEHRAIFIDPTSLAVRGDLTVYGTSGVLPLRRFIDQLHRNLMQGDIGRLYSELAASWLWLAALGGLAIWAFSPSPRVDAGKQTRTAKRLRTRRRHSLLGLVLLIGLLALSATGMTWSKWAGANFFTLLKAGGWGTPRVSLDLGAPSATNAHADHQAAHTQTALFDAGDADRVLAAARHAGLDAGKIELRVPGPGQAWKVREIDRSWPSQVDEVAVNPHTFAVIDQVRFVDYPLPAKLTRWGIDAHMGVLFGLPNQLLLAALGVGIIVMVCWGYVMWWRRRQPNAGQALWPLLRRLPPATLITLGVIALGLGVAMPVMGVSLLVLLAIDGLRGDKRAAASEAASGSR